MAATQRPRGSSNSLWTPHTVAGWWLPLLFVAAMDARQAVAQGTDQNVVVILDDSGSMQEEMADGRQRKIDAAKAALARVLEQLDEQTTVGVLTLNSRIGQSHWAVPLGNPDPERWQSQLQQIHANGGTPLGLFMKVGADELLKLRGDRRYGVYRLLVVTDGEATDPGLLSTYTPELIGRGIILDVIGVHMRADHSLAALAHSYRRADDLSTLQQAIADVFAETGGTDQDSVGDFQLLAGLPDDVAAEMLNGLAAPNNQPLSPIEQVVPAQTVAPSNPPPAGMNPQPSGMGGTTFGGIVGSLFCCCAGLLVPMLLIGVLLGSAKRRRR